MNKSKNLNRPILKYLRELSVVVIGISITVGIGLGVNRSNSKKDLELYLSAVKLELEENERNLDKYAAWLQKSYRYAEYLRLNDKKSLNRDSLWYYSTSTSFYDDVDRDNYGCGFFSTRSFSSIFTTNAFEMLKFSGTMRQLKNKELLLSIWNTYVFLEEFKVMLDSAFQEKAEEAKRELPLLFTEGKLNAIPMLLFYTSENPYAMIGWCKITSETVKGTRLKLEKQK